MVMDVFEALADAESRGRPAVLVTVVAVEGEAPARPGAKLVVVDGSVTAGTLGCSEFDTAGVELAVPLAASAVDGPAMSGGAMSGGATSGGAATLRRRVVFGHGEERALELFAERYDPRPGVVVVGGTPVGRAVASLAEVVGRRVRLLDGDDPGAALRALPPGPRDAILLSDHDAPYVDEVLRYALASDAFFVGMLGSRRHVPEVVRRVREVGTHAGRLARLRSPCGLDIGSRTPEEIALSIVAEVIAAERGREGGRMGLDWSRS